MCQGGFDKYKIIESSSGLFISIELHWTCPIAFEAYKPQSFLGIWAWMVVDGCGM